MMRAVSSDAIGMWTTAATVRGGPGGPGAHAGHGGYGGDIVCVAHGTRSLFAVSCPRAGSSRCRMTTDDWDNHIAASTLD